MAMVKSEYFISQMLSSQMLSSQMSWTK